MINDALKPLDSLDTICLDLSLYCIYIITYIEDLSTTFYTVDYTVYTVEAPLDPIYSIRGILTIVEE